MAVTATRTRRETNSESTSNAVIFGDLPAAPARQGSTNWPEMLSQVKARPNTWAKIATKATKGTIAATRTNLSRQYTKAEGGNFEFRVRDLDLWARFIPQGT